MKMLINATQRDELRSVIVSESNRLLNYDVDTPQQEQKKSNIYKAVVTSIEPSLGALFVNFGSERTGFLPFSNISPEYYSQDSRNPQHPDLYRLFKLGQELVVQVEKDERGNKGAALTTYISLAGSYCVLMPNNAKGGGISRQIEGKERENLQEKIEQLKIPEGMGLIVRTAGVNRSAEELSWDMNILLSYWDAIKQAAIAKPGPYLIHQESNVVLRSVRDNLREDINEVIIDNEEAFQEVHDYIRLVRPDFLDRIKLHKSTTPLFSHYGIEGQIEMAYQHELQLPSGGSIVIDHTEALISIDVNSARATKGGNIEETALQTNLEAAEEVARQLRIRDLGGLIIIDFIDMTPMQNRREVENRLRDALKMDRARIQTERISRFGLLEMSRQRLRRALTRTIKNVCPRCKGQGMIQSVESLASTIIHKIEQQIAKATSPQHFTVHAPTPLATYLINERRGNINKIESDGVTQVSIIPNPHIKTPDYTLKNANASSSEGARQMNSYEKIKRAKNPTGKPKQQAARTFDEPIMNQYLSMPDAPSNLGGGTSLFKRLITRMFGDEKTVETAAPASKKAAPKKAPSKAKTNTRSNNNKHRSSSKDSQKNELPIPSTTRKVDEKKSNARPARKSENNKTRRGSRGGTRNTTTKQETKNPEQKKQPNQKQQQPNPAKKQSKPAPKESVKSVAETPAAPKAKKEATPKKPVAERTKPAEKPVTEVATPAKKARRSLSSAKTAGGNRSSRATGGKKPSRQPTNPAKRIKPRTKSED